MSGRAIRAIIGKDLRVVSRARGVMIPLVIVPVVFLVVFPAVAGLVVANVDLADPALSDFTMLLDNMPPGLLDEFGAPESKNAQVLLYMLVYFFAPFFLIVPLMVASVIAADSFAGEKERKTLEALIYSPTSDQELYLAKVLSPWVAAVVVTVAGLVGYAVIANAVAWPLLGRIFFPNLMWLILTLWVAPAAAGLGLGTMVLVSSRVSGFQEAYQLGGMVVLPVLLLIVGQLAGVIYFSVEFVVLIGLVLWALDLAILWYGARTFQRGELLARL